MSVPTLLVTGASGHLGRAVVRHLLDTLNIDPARVIATYGGDQHRADLAYASYALSRGVPIPAIESAIASRDLSHKGGPSRQRDYIDRTIKRAQERSGPSR